MDIFEFAAMIEETPVRTRVIEYRATEPGSPPSDSDRLAAVCLTDVLDDGLSLVYSFYDPAEVRRSLGRFAILDHVRQAGIVGLPFVYLGYWVRGSRKMDYKAEFRPAEALRFGGWEPLE